MATINLLYKNEVRVNDKIAVVIPKIRDVIADEESYYSLISSFTSMPIDRMVQLEDAGVDFTTINEYELFLMLFPSLMTQDTSLILKDIDLRKFAPAISEDNGGIVLLDAENDIVIDRAIHAKIANTLRSLHHLTKDSRKPANDEAKKYMLERARTKFNRRKNRAVESQLEPLIISMVNTEQFKYDYDGVLDLTIYQFNESVRQVIKKIDYQNVIYGVYAGTVDAKGLSPEKLDWIRRK